MTRRRTTKSAFSPTDQPRSGRLGMEKLGSDMEGELAAGLLAWPSPRSSALTPGSSFLPRPAFASLTARCAAGLSPRPLRLTLTVLLATHQPEGLVVAGPPGGSEQIG